MKFSPHSPQRIAATIIVFAAGATLFVACESSSGDGVGSGGTTTPAPSASEDERGSVGVPPTAAGYCVMLGYTLADSRCTFPDGTSCEEWSFYRGECGQPHSYCNQHGGTISNKIDDAGTFTATYGVCDLNGKQCEEGNFVASGKCE